MVARRDGSDGLPPPSRGHGGTSAWSPQPAGERVRVMPEVVEPLLRRADLLSQLLRIGYAHDPQGQKAGRPGR